MKNWIKVLIIAAVTVVLGGGGYVAYQQTHKTTTPTVSQEQSQTITYDGEESKSAYELLQSKYKVEATEGSFGVMVNSINGLKATTTKFWLYSVNGNQPDVAADKYQTHTGDKITWEYKGM